MPDQESRPDAEASAAKPAERRRYNRRRPDVESAAPPPYHEIFERIAAALEGIERVVRSDVTAQQTARPRETAENARR